MKNYFYLFFLLVQGFFLPAFADSVHLVNGDVLHGKLEMLDAGKLAFTSDNFGKLDIDRAKITHLLVDSPLVKAGGEAGTECKLVSQSADAYTLECESLQEDYTLATLPVLQQKKPVEAPRWKQKGSLRVAATSSSGNTDEESWDLAAKTRFSKGIHRHSLALDFENEIDNRGHSDEFYEFRYAYDRFLDEHWFWNNSFTFTRDVASDIDARYKLGSGLGYRFWSEESRELEVESGLVYVKQNFVGKGNDETEYLAASWRLAWWRSWDDIRLFHDHELVVSFEQPSDYVLETETGIKYHVNSHLYGEFKYEWDRDNVPARGADKNDSKWTMGVGYDW